MWATALAGQRETPGCLSTSLSGDEIRPPTPWAVKSTPCRSYPVTTRLTSSLDRGRPTLRRAADDFRCEAQNECCGHGAQQLSELRDRRGSTITRVSLDPHLLRCEAADICAEQGTRGIRTPRFSIAANVGSSASQSARWSTKAPTRTLDLHSPMRSHRLCPSTSSAWRAIRRLTLPGSLARAGRRHERRTFAGGGC